MLDSLDPLSEAMAAFCHGYKIHKIIIHLAVFCHRGILSRPQITAPFFLVPFSWLHFVVIPVLMCSSSNDLIKLFPVKLKLLALAGHIKCNVPWQKLLQKEMHKPAVIQFAPKHTPFLSHSFCPLEKDIV